METELEQTVLFPDVSGEQQSDNSESLPNLIIYTDGAYKPSTDQGGWAFVAIENDKVIKSDYNSEKNTTNNRMEIMGVLKAIEYFNGQSRCKTCTIYTDSQYVWGTIVKNWKRNKNHDLWEKIDKIISPKVEVKWVKGHDNNPYNNMADKLAVKGSELL